jgi:hypothetical protein
MTPAVRCGVLVIVLLVSAGCGGPGRSTSAEGIAPTIVSVDLSPQPAYANNTLTALVRLKGTDGSSVHYAYQWRKNDQIIDGATEAALPNTFFKKGDVVTVTVTAGNGRQAGVAMTSHPSTITDSAPVVMAVALTPAPLHQQMTVHAAVQSSDVDGDTISYGYQWLKDGVPIPGETGESLDGAMVSRGNRIQVQVTPFDGEVRGDARLSEPVTVKNAPPRITSQPTTSLDRDDTYVYQVAAEDSDGDPIIYSLTSAPEGMTIDPESGLIRWKVTRKDKGIHPIEITVANDDGAKTMQRYDLRIDDLTEPSTPSQF